jgi:Tripartite tricarboxylate transporter family receptor
MKNRKREICTSGSVRDEDGQPPHLLGHRRQFLHLAAGAATLPVFPRVARAQAYPSRPARIIVGLTAGSASDIVARLVGQWLSERLGQPFVIENRPDGYTLLLVASPNAINASLYDKLSFNFIRDIAPVAAISREPNVVVVNPSLPTKTVPEFIAYAKANSGRINMASAGNGSTSHLAGELFNRMTDVNLVHVPYRGGGSALTDLLAGQVQVFFPPMVVPIGQVKAGKLRALAVTTATARRRCRTFRRWASSCRAMKRASGSGSARRRARPLKSSTSSTSRPTPLSPIRRSKHGWLSPVAMRSQARLPTSQSSLPTKPRSGPR